jgi:hypothetical protein
MALKEYKPGTAFPGTIRLTTDQSSPAWPEPLRAREGTPNVLFIVLDDTGYGHLGCYQDSSDICFIWVGLYAARIVRVPPPQQHQG